VPTAASNSFRAVRWIAATTAWAVAGMAIVLALFLTAPRLLGYESLTVLSGSMEPALPVGSVVLDERISPLDARPGDVVTFPSPDDRSRLITHRVRSITVQGGDAAVVTKGDANDAPERWRVPVSGQIGRVVYRVPKLGYAREWTSGARLRRVLILIAFVLGAWILVDIWRPRKNAAPGQADDGLKYAGGGTDMKLEGQVKEGV
jgi:signal peptidase I